MEVRAVLVEHSEAVSLSGVVNADTRAAAQARRDPRRLPDPASPPPTLGTDALETPPRTPAGKGAEARECATVLHTCRGTFTFTP